MEYYVNEIPYSYFSIDAAIVFAKIYHEKSGVLPSSNIFDLIEELEEGFYIKDLACNMQKVYSNESGSLERFVFVRWYADKEVYLDFI